MKKKELVLLIREAVLEGVMENLTTVLSRLIVNHLKKFGHGASIPPFKGQVDDLLVHIVFKKYDGPLKHAGGHYDALGRVFAANVLVPANWTEQELSAFIPKFKNLIRHELEHYRQDQRSGYEEPSKGVHYTMATLPKIDHSANQFVAIDQTKAYLLRPREIEAWVMGMYKQAKTEKLPLETVMQRQAAELVNHLSDENISRKAAVELAAEVIRVWKDYALKRLPGAKIVKGDFIK